MSDDEIKQALNDAYEYPFQVPVTSYLTNAQVIACCCVGEVHRHIRADNDGWFADWHRVRTSEIRHVMLDGDYWVIRTESGSHYVLVTFHVQGGKESLRDYVAHLVNGLFPSPKSCH